MCLTGDSGVRLGGGRGPDWNEDAVCLWPRARRARARKRGREACATGWVLQQAPVRPAERETERLRPWPADVPRPRFHRPAAIHGPGEARRLIYLRADRAAGLEADLLCHSVLASSAPARVPRTAGNVCVEAPIGSHAEERREGLVRAAPIWRPAATDPGDRALRNRGPAGGVNPVPPAPAA